MRMPRVLLAACAVVAVGALLTESITDALRKAKLNSAMKRARILGSAVFSTGADSASLGLAFTRWRQARCAAEDVAGPAAIWMSESELTSMIAAQSPSSLDVDKLRPLSDLRVGSFCYCPSPLFWIDSGSLVWADGFFVSRPSGLDGVDRVVNAVGCEESSVLR